MGQRARWIGAAAAAATVIGLMPGVALAHTGSIAPAARCLDGGGWEATATLQFGDPEPISGTISSTYPSGTSTAFSLASGENRTFGAGVVIPTSVTAVTFSVTATWSDEFPFSGEQTVTVPADCAPTVTTLAETTTTTTTPGATTTTLATDDGLSITALTPICVRDVPFVLVTFGDQPQFDGRTATVTFIDLRGNVVATHTATYRANTSVMFVYPGASVDADGNPTDWPGWRWDGDEWVPDPTDDYLRDGLTVRVEVNPTATGQVSYPPMTSACANPTNRRITGTLPATGRTDGRIVAVAGMALVAGLAALLLARRPSTR